MSLRIQSVNALISVAIGVLLLLGIGTMVFYVSSSFYTNTFDIETRNMRESARTIQTETNEYLDVCLALVRSLTIQQQVQALLAGDSGLSGPVTDQLASVVKTRDYLSSAFVVDRNGKVVVGRTSANGAMDGTDLSGKTYWPEVLQGKESIGSKLVKGAASGALVFIVVAPVKDGAGKVIGAAGLSVNWSKFVEKSILPVKVGKAGYAYILDAEGTLIAHPDPASVLQNVSSLPFVRDALARKNGVLRYEYKGVEKVQAFNQIERTGWLVCVNDTEEELAAEAVRQRNLLILGGAGGFVVLLGLILLLVRRFVLTPLQNVQAYAAQVAAGNYGASLEGSFRYELDALARNVSHMTGELKDKLSFSQSVLEGIATPFFIGDKDGRLAYANRPMLDLMDRPGRAEDYLGKTVSDFVYGVPSRDSITVRTLRENKVYNGVESDLTIHSGKQMHVRIDCAPLYDLDRNLSGAITTVLDVTHLKEQQDRIESQNERITTAADTSEAISGAMTQATERLSAQVEQCSRGAQAQSRRVGETAAAMQQMSATVLEVARNASQAVETADKTRRKAEDGAGIVSRVVGEIALVQRQSLELKDDMGQLGRQAQGIGQIMNVISDIADQTNLLALNAAIEAARAGEAGRGFAVVADEVRKLAEKTMAATQEVGQAISSIQQGTAKNIGNVERAVATIDESTRLAGTSGEALAEIVALVDQTTDQVRSIATACEQQSAATEQINRSVEEVSRISVDTSGSMEHAAQAVRELAEEARTLREMIESMKSGDDAPQGRSALAR